MARLCPLFSGSGGNSYYIGSRSAGLLIDAGRSARQLDRMLQRCGIDPMAIQGILITHEHSDHIAGVRVFAKKYGIPVFASQGTLLAMQPSLEGVESWVLEGPLQLAGMEVIPFATPHDSAQSLGFRIQTADGRQFALATDLGAVTPRACGSTCWGRSLWCWSPTTTGRCCATGPTQPISSGGFWRGQATCPTGTAPPFCRSWPVRGPSGFCWPISAGRTTRPPWPGRRAVSALSAAGYQEGTGFWLDVAPVENQEGKSIVF